MRGNWYLTIYFNGCIIVQEVVNEISTITRVWAGMSRVAHIGSEQLDAKTFLTFLPAEAFGFPSAFVLPE